jgi:predicted aspartyl protease
METDMGRVVTEVTIENLGDLLTAERGLLPPEQVRRVTLTDAMVDTGATLLSMPTRLIRQLGLTKQYTKRVTDGRGGVGEVDAYGPVRLTIQGRTCPTDVLEVPENVPVLVGQLPLEYLDLVIDMRAHKLIGNPAHGGEHMFEMY